MMVLFSYSNDPNNQLHFVGQGPEIFDDATTNQILQVDSDKLVGSAEVSVRMEHPRVADTVLTLVSPQGSRIILAENRGQTNGLGFGAEFSTNMAYTIFTDDTNYAEVPIKFGPPPFTDTTRVLSPVWTNGFEGVNAGLYAKGQLVDGWTVSSNSVKVYADANLAFEGTNFILLGRLGAATNLGSNFLPSVFEEGLGAHYKLDGNALDSTANHLDGTNYNAISAPDHLGNANGAMFFNGSDAYIDCGNPVQFNFSSNFTISAWAKLNGYQRDKYVVAKYNDQGGGRRSSYSYGMASDLNSHNYGFVLGSGNIYYDARGTKNINDGQWHAMVYSYEKAFGLRIYTDGHLDSQLAAPAYPPFSNNVPLLIAKQVSGQQFGGWIDNVRIYGRALSTQEVANLYQLELDPVLPGGITRTIGLTPGKAYELRFFAANTIVFKSTNDSTVYGSVEINGKTKAFSGGTNWTYNAIPFLAKSNSTTITISSGDTPLFVDQVQIVETGNRYYLPEEPLALLQGERSIGQWKLELLDNKTGAEVPLPELLSWKLDLIYADPLVLAEPLQNNRTYPKTLNINQTNWITPGTLFTNQTHYFLVNTCPDTTEATVTLIGSNNVGQVEMLIDRSGIPTGNAETDDYVPLLNTDTPNNTPNGSATFRITTNSPASAPLEPGKPFFIVVRNRSVNTTNSYMLNIRLDRSSCVTRQSTPLIKRQSITSMLSATAPSDENQGELYSVEVPEGSQSVSVNVAAVGDVAIVAQKDVMPTRESYSLAQDAFGPGTERLTIDSNSSVPLSAGTWYFLLLNQAPRPVVYSIVATGDLPDQGGGVIIDVQRLNDWIQITWYGDAGSNYTIQSSTDLENWTDLDTVAASGGTLTYTTTTGFGKQQFFRIVKN
jgi:subtilisin-like proprotein convertase family protein